MTTKCSTERLETTVSHSREPTAPYSPFQICGANAAGGSLHCSQGEECAIDNPYACGLLLLSPPPSARR